MQNCLPPSIDNWNNTHVCMHTNQHQQESSNYLCLCLILLHVFTLLVHKTSSLSVTLYNMYCDIILLYMTLAQTCSIPQTYNQHAINLRPSMVNATPFTLSLPHTLQQCRIVGNGNGMQLMGIALFLPAVLQTNWTLEQLLSGHQFSASGCKILCGFHSGHTLQRS